jgi:methylaspartate ammonia-lyase
MSAIPAATIRDVLCVEARAGYFNKDLAAVRAGARGNGFHFEGAPLTPGYDSIAQPGEAIAVMLLLDDGQVALGDCMDVIFAGAAGRDRRFRAADHLLVLGGELAARLRGRDVGQFRPLAAEMDAWTVDGQPIHTALRYGLSQALLHAAALAGRCTMAQVVVREYGCAPAVAPVPVLAMCPTDQRIQVDKMVLKGAELLPHASFSSARRDLGPDGANLLEYAAWVAQRVRTLGAPGYRPTVHLDLYGTLGELYAMDSTRIADFIIRMEAAVAPLPLLVETPVVAATREAQIASLCGIRELLVERGSAVGLVADEWANTLDDIRAFADAQAAHYVQVKAPDLGSLGNSVEALLYCRARGVGAYLGGSANETDVSARVSAHVAIACNADVLIAKPGQGVDEALMLLGNEMRRTLALMRAP